MSDSSPDPTIEEILASIRRIISEDELAPAPVVARQASAFADEGDPLILKNVLNGSGAHDALNGGEAAAPGGLEATRTEEPEPAAFRPAPAPEDLHDDGEALLLEDVAPPPAAEGPFLSEAQTTIPAAWPAAEPEVPRAAVPDGPAAETPPPEAPMLDGPAPEPVILRAAAPAAEDRPLEAPLVDDRTAAAMAQAFGALERSLQLPPSGRTLEDLIREMLRPLLKAWLEEHLPAIVEARVAEEVARIARQRR